MCFLVDEFTWCSPHNPPFWSLEKPSYLSRHQSFLGGRCNHMLLVTERKASKCSSKWYKHLLLVHSISESEYPCCIFCNFILLLLKTEDTPITWKDKCQRSSCLHSRRWNWHLAVGGTGENFYHCFLNTTSLLCFSSASVTQTVIHLTQILWFEELGTCERVS